MSSESQQSSFSHAFLPGLILGLVVGAVAGAFLPDFLGGSSIPAADGTPAHTTTQRDGQEPPTDAEIQEMIDQAGQQADDAADTLEDAAEDASDAIPTEPITPPSDG